MSHQLNRHLSPFALSHRLSCSLVGAALLGAGSADAADSRPFPHEQIRGDTRLVLMSVGQTLVFPNDNPSEPKAGDHRGVPCFTVTYLLESLGDKPFRGSALRKLEVTQAGKPLPLSTNHQGSYHKAYDYGLFPPFLDFAKPRVTDPARAIVFQHVVFGTLPNLRPFDLVIAAGFDEEVPEFKFSSVRIH